VVDLFLPDGNEHHACPDLPIKLGRSGKCTVRFPNRPDSPVSWEHAAIDAGPAGLVVRDLGSSNGTYLNGNLVTGDTPVGPGDTISLGKNGPKVVVRPSRVGPAAAPKPGAGSVPDGRAPAGRPPVAEFVPPPVARAQKVAQPAPARDARAPEILPRARRVVDEEAEHPAAPGSSSRAGFFALISAALVGLVAAVGVAVFVLGRSKLAPAPATDGATAGVVPQPVASTPAVAAGPATPPPPAPVPQPQPTPAPPPAPPPPADRPLTGPEIYKSLLKSTAFILRADRQAQVSSGSGVLVNAEHRLLATNHHVIDKAKKIVVFFPAYEGTGEVITDVKHYLKRAPTLRVEARVVATNPSADLALLKLDHLPPGVQAVPFAAKPAEAGQLVYSIGGSGVGDDGHLWRLTTGTVRTRKKSRPQDIGLNAWILETQAPVNPGDSGGPVVTDRVELVAVVAHFLVSERLVSGNIDLSEIRDLLARYARAEGISLKDAAGSSSP